METTRPENNHNRTRNKKKNANTGNIGTDYSSDPNKSKILTKSNVKIEENIKESFISIGDHLKSLREVKGLPLTAISQRTKINISVLKALEENRLDHLPDKTYVKGFIRSYAKEINADIDFSLEILEETYQEFYPETIVSEEKEEDLPQKKEFSEEVLSHLSQFLIKLNSIPKKTKKTIFASALAIMGISFVVSQISKAPQKMAEAAKAIEKNQLAKQQAVESKTITAKKINTPTENTETKEQQKAIIEKEEGAKEVAAAEVKMKETPKTAVTEPKTENETKTSTLDAKNNTYVVDANSHPQEDTSALSSVPELSRDHNFINFRLPLYEIDATNPINQDLSIMPSKYKKSLKPGINNVFIKAQDGDTWLTYKVDNGPIKSFTLKEGRSLLLRGDLVRIFLGNVNVTRVFLDNSYLKINAPTGVKSLVFPQTAAVKFKIPLFVRDTQGNRIGSDAYLNAVKKFGLPTKAKSPSGNDDDLYDADINF